MRAEDFAEVGCLWKTWSTQALGRVAMETAVDGMVWSVWYEGQPAAAYGFSYAAPFDPDHWQAWAFGTKHFKRCVPMMTRHLQAIRPTVEKHCRRCQVVTYVNHDISHGWLEALGAEREGMLRSYGRNGENFYVYSWVRGFDAA